MKIDFRILREYINKNLKKGFIRLLSLLTESPILFILKKDKKKRFYINYRKLNIIIIKDYYILLLVNKLRNRFNRIKIFIKLNLYKVYNLICIKKSKE